MPKGPKYKQGFTWRHHLDEWWDRRPQEWKIRLFLWTGMGVVLGALGIYLWMHRWMEREEILAEAGRIHQQRIAAADKALVPVRATDTAPRLRGNEAVGTRPAE